MAIAISEREKNARGIPLKLAKGGAVPFQKSGKPMSPLTKAKMENGIPGFKKGGKVAAKKDKC